MAVEKSTQSRGKRGNVCALPLRSGPKIDVEKLLLGGQSTPIVRVPPEVRRAIDVRARELAAQAFTLCREHLERRVAYQCEFGYPNREINMSKALSVIAEGDLGAALAQEFINKLGQIRYCAEHSAAVSAELIEKLKDAEGANHGC